MIVPPALAQAAATRTAPAASMPDPYLNPAAYEAWLADSAIADTPSARVQTADLAYRKAMEADAAYRRAAASLPPYASEGALGVPNATAATEAVRTDGSPDDETWRMYLPGAEAAADPPEDAKDRTDVNAMAANFADQIYRKEILDKDPFDNIPANMEYAAIERRNVNQARELHRPSTPAELSTVLQAYGMAESRAAWAAEALVNWRATPTFDSQPAPAQRPLRSASMSLLAPATEAMPPPPPPTPAPNDPTLPPNGNMPVDAAMAPPPPDAMPIGGGMGGAPPDAFGGPAAAAAAMDDPDPLAGIPDPLAEDDMAGPEGGGDAEMVQALEAILQVLEAHPEAPPEVIAVIEQLAGAQSIDDLTMIIGQAAEGATPQAQPIFAEMLEAVGGAPPANSQILPGDDETAMLDDVQPALDMGPGAPPPVPDDPGAAPMDTTPPEGLTQDDQIRRSLGEAIAAEVAHGPSIAELEAWVNEGCPGCQNQLAQEIDTMAKRAGAAPYKTGPHPAKNIEAPGTANTRSKMTGVKRKPRASGGGSRRRAQGTGAAAQ